MMTATKRIALVLLLFIPWSPAAGDDEFQTTVSPFLEKHCYTCHGPEKQESRIRYDQIDGFRIEDRNLWTMVHEMLSAGEMPPDYRPQPSESEKRQVLSWIEKEQRVLGTGNTRRLNRREISAALQDVTGLAVNFADSLPADGTVAGFDTGAEGLQDAASSVVQMMDVARRAVDGIRFLEPASGKVFSADLREVKDARKALDSWEEDGADPKTRGYAKPGAGLLIEPKWLGERGDISIAVPVPSNGRGILRMRLVLSLEKYFAGVPNPHLWVEVGGKDIDYREITATRDAPQVLVYEVQLDDLAVAPDGVTIALSNRVEVPYAVKGFENEDKSKPDEKISGGPGLFRPVYNRKSPPEQQPVPFIALQQIQIEPNYVAAWPPNDWQAEVGELGDDQSSAERLLNLWIERAWRRPVSKGEQERFLAFYRNLRGQGFSFDAALRAVFQSVLLGGPFRYLPSPTHPDAVVSQHAIAARLSFMLVGAPPDGELRRLAAEGKLREPAVLDSQVDRLLADPRSEAFVRPFVTQWLEMEQPITITMDYFQAQDFRFARLLKDSMRKETIGYVAQLFQENRTAKELIDSEWTLMNNSLARHYGYEGIEGGHLRKVKLRNNDPRGGGILGHAGIQSMLCWMGENWVIYRGAWALRHILDDPPPLPPLEVPELDPMAGENRGKTFRELLAQHQADTKCAVCHKKMDPLGFAFQNFDISGRWRDAEYEKYIRNELDGKIEWRGEGRSRPVDAAGQLPRGEEFSSYPEFKEIVMENYVPDLVRGLMKNLMLYATGRKPDVEDMAVIRSIMNEQSSRGYPMRDLVKAVVRSRGFLER